MSETVKRLLRFHGSNSKVIIWEHNTHVGDAHYTDMSRAGKTNIGELLRREYGASRVFIVGFGSYSGSVIAANSWGSPYQEMQVPAAIPGSWEEILHQQGADDKIIISSEIRKDRNLNGWINQRAIGAVYQPKREKFGNYIPSVIPQRYDAFLFFDQTNALHPINPPQKFISSQSDTTHWDF
jgi:erythromycin esterase